jgi:class 3 adenylate cyclase
MLDQAANYSTKGIPLVLQQTEHTFAQNTSATLLYADLRGFNGLAEHLQPSELVPLLRALARSGRPGAARSRSTPVWPSAFTGVMWPSVSSGRPARH